MKTSEAIERYILSLFEDNHTIKIKRNELATNFACAPSQINYVLTTRFTIVNGYIVESKRGGGGYIKIYKIPIEDKKDLIKLINSIPTECDSLTSSAILKYVVEKNILNFAEYNIMLNILSEETLLSHNRNENRSRIIRKILEYKLLNFK